MKNIIKILILTVVGFTNSSLVTHELVRELELLDNGWDSHFRNHKNKKDHLDFGKFRDTETSDTLMVLFLFPQAFDTNELKKGQVFSVGISSIGLIKADDYDIPVFAINEADLKKYGGYQMMSLKNKKN